MTSLTANDLLECDTREFIILAGKDGSGKSSALVSLASYVYVMNPDAKFFIIDAENKLASVLKTWGPDVPQNIVYFRCSDMNAVTDAVDEVIAQAKPGDWCAAESMSRIWEKAQNLGYNAVSGMDKAAWMEKRREYVRANGRQGAPAVTPKPDDLWSITKGAHDSAFLEPLSQHPTLNVLLTTTIAKPPKADAFIKESETRKDIRKEFGIDVGLEGAPRLPYYAQTLCLFDRRNNITYCRVVRDNLTSKDDSECEFEVPTRKEWAITFMLECR